MKHSNNFKITIFLNGLFVIILTCVVFSIAFSFREEFSTDHHSGFFYSAATFFAVISLILFLFYKIKADYFTQAFVMILLVSVANFSVFFWFVYYEFFSEMLSYLGFLVIGLGFLWTAGIAITIGLSILVLIGIAIHISYGFAQEYKSSMRRFIQISLLMEFAIISTILLLIQIP